jgi:hypothetical protein
LFVALALFDVVAILTVSFLSNYQPLVHGNYGGIGVPTGQKLRPGSGPGTQAITFVEGQTFTIALSVLNDGPFGVTITSVGRQGPVLHALATFDTSFLAAADFNGATTDVRGLATFRPFALAPGHQRLVVVRYRFDDCSSNAPGSSSTLSTIPVRFRIMGVSRAGSVDLIGPVQVDPPDVCHGRPETP